MATITRHMVVDISGVLRWKGRELQKLFTNSDGSKASVEEIKEFLIEKLADGHRVLPFGKECEGFDKVTGCPGHPAEDNELITAE